MKFKEIKVDNDICETTIILIDRNNKTVHLEKWGNLNSQFPECCVLWPSKDCRDWSKFTAPWYKKEREKFDPKTLQPYDKVLVKCNNSESWKVQLFSHIIEGDKICPYVCISYNYKYCIPYNNDTKHLVGTNEEAPEYYIYWED